MVDRPMIDMQRVAWLKQAIEARADVVVNRTACHNALTDLSHNDEAFVFQATQAVVSKVAGRLHALSGTDPAGVSPATFLDMVRSLVGLGLQEPVARQIVTEWAMALDVEVRDGARSAHEVLTDPSSPEDEVVAVLTDSDLVIHAEPNDILRAVLRFRHRDEVMMQLLARGAYLFPALDPGERLSLLHLVALQEGLPSSPLPREGAGWAVDWVLWRPSSPHVAIGRSSWGRIVALSPDGAVVAVTRHQDVGTWHLPSGAVGEPHPGHHGAVDVAAFSWDHEWLVTGSKDKTAIRWDVVSGEPRPLGAHGGAVSAVAFTPDGKHVLTGSSTGDGHVFDTATGDLAGKWAWLGAIRHLAAPDERVVAGAGDSSPAMLVDWRHAAQNGSLGETRPLAQLAANPARRQVGLVGREHAELWELGDGALRMAFALTGPPADTLAFADDGNVVAVAGRDGAIRLYGTTEGEPRGRVGELADRCRHMAISRELAGIVTVDDLDLVQIWSLPAATDDRVGPVVGRVADVALIGQDQVAIADARPGVLLRPAAGTGAQHTLAGAAGTVRLVAASLDAERLLTVGEDGWVREWSLDGQALGLRERPCRADIRGLVFDGSGRVVTASSDGVVRSWKDLPFDGTARELLQAPASLCSVAVSRDGGTAAVGTADGRVHCARFDDDQRWIVVAEHSVGTAVSAVALSSEGTWGASAGARDRRVSLWGTDGTPMAELLDHGSEVASIAFSPDGSLVATGCRDGVVQVFFVRTVLTTRTPALVERMSCIPVRSPVVKVLWTTDDQLLVAASSGLVSVSFSNGTS